MQYQKLLWDKYLTREYSFLIITYGLDCYQKSGLRRFDLAKGEGNLVSLYSTKQDTVTTFKMLETMVRQNSRSLLASIDDFPRLTAQLKTTAADILRSKNKSDIKASLLKFDALFIEAFSTYLLLVYLGYAGDIPVVGEFIQKYLKQLDNIRNSGLDTDIESSLPKLFGQYNAKLRALALHASRKELLNVLKGKKLDLKKINQRKKKYLLIMRNGKLREYPFGDVDTVFKREVMSAGAVESEVRGKIAWSGTAKGKVVLVFSRKDYKKIKQGDILVTPMTKPDIVPYLRKVTAIVTNDGGTLCHAAIISREMKIPCVVGTKYATDQLCDGDLVEVDAGKGVVKILKKG